MSKLINTNGMNIDDIEEILIQEGKVVSRETYGDIHYSYANIISLCVLAADGNEKAIDFLKSESLTLFNSFVSPEHRDFLLDETKKELEAYSKDLYKKNLEQDFESLLTGYAEYVALNALAREGDNLANRYINDNAVEDFNGFVPDENKGMILERVKNRLDDIYSEVQENESGK